MTRQDARSGLILIALVALAGGVTCLFLSSGLSFTAPRGERIGSLFSLNPLGSLVTIALSLAALAGALVRARTLVTIAGAAFGASAVLQLVQLGAETNWLGGRPSTFSFFLAAGAGLLVVNHGSGAKAEAS